ncbi:MAG TPA: hypothetical protein PLF63_15010 [Rubrivivax sp.]|nr:hypothetical protein [Rubrivivax sp.]
MTAQALSAVTLETLENMRLAAMTTARATIAGGRRLPATFCGQREAGQSPVVDLAGIIDQSVPDQ